MNSGPVVSNTTPLINLAGIQLLDILPHLYGSILLPRDVVNEFQTKAAPNDPDLGSLSWVTIQENIAYDRSLPKLGAGETAAISLAPSSLARLILLDERKARRIALSRGLNVTGTLSILLRAKSQQLISSVKPYLEAMQAQGRYFGDALVADVLNAAGE